MLGDILCFLFSAIYCEAYVALDHKSPAPTPVIPKTKIPFFG